MNDKPFIIGSRDLLISSGGLSEPLGIVADAAVTLRTAIQDTTEIIQIYNWTYTFTLQMPSIKLRMLRFGEFASRSKRNPLKAKEIMEFIKNKHLI